MLFCVEKNDPRTDREKKHNWWLPQIKSTTKKTYNLQYLKQQWIETLSSVSYLLHAVRPDFDNDDVYCNVILVSFIVELPFVNSEQESQTNPQDDKREFYNAIYILCI